MMSEIYPGQQEVELRYIASVHQHIEYVRQAGLLIGVPRDRLFKHDLSKFTTLEVYAYARHFQGDKGDKPAFDKAWLSHIHKNDHHWQHHLLQEDSGKFQALMMSEEAALEMVADWMGASKMYGDTEWDMTNWLNKNFNRMVLHENTRELVKKILDMTGHIYCIGNYFEFKPQSIFQVKLVKQS